MGQISVKIYAPPGSLLSNNQHSNGFGVTAVTVATLARAPDRPRPHLRNGHVYLSRPLGAFKLHYLSEMGVEDRSAQIVEMLESDRSPTFPDAPWALVTDVSGHGLLGAASQVAAVYGLDMNLTLSEASAVAPMVLAIPVDCLQNPDASYGVQLSGTDWRAIALATLRETAGPFLGFAEGDDNLDGNSLPGIPIGQYAKGSGGISISWIE